MIIEPKLLDRIWPGVWPLIKDIVVLESEEDLLRELRVCNRFLLIVGDGVAIICPHGELMEIMYVGGKKAKDWWPKMNLLIDTIAASYKCKKIVAFGRDAWKKIAPDFKPTNTRMFIKEVNNG